MTSSSNKTMRVYIVMCEDSENKTTMVVNVADSAEKAAELVSAHKCAHDHLGIYSFWVEGWAVE